MESIHKKIKTLTELPEIILNAKKNGKKVVHCHGVFDLLHLGHLRHFQEAKSYGDLLIVTVTPDQFASKAPGRPVFNQYQRAEAVANLQNIDYVAINQWPTAIETLLMLKPDIYVKGNDYKKGKDDITGQIVHEAEAIRFVGGEIRFTDDITFSSSKLINDQFHVFSEEARQFLADFKKRYSANEIIEKIEQVKNLNVLVIGDAIIDEYCFCRPMNKSSKENIIPAQYLSEERYAGGSLAIANHIAGFCNRVTLVTAIKAGDEYEEFIHQHSHPNIDLRLFYLRDPKGMTTVKRRFVDAEFMNKLYEICYLNDSPGIYEAVQPEIISYVDSVIDSYDLVLVADFGHGIMTKKLIQFVAENSRYLAVNTQMNSANLGFNVITKYPAGNYICIDEQEVRMAMHDKYDQIENVMTKLKSSLKEASIIVTRGRHGSTALDEQGNRFIQVPVFSDKVVDRVGAGDAYLSISSLLACTGNPMELTAFVGNLAGALKVHYICNKFSIEPVKLFKLIRTLLK